MIKSIDSGDCPKALEAIATLKTLDTSSIKAVLSATDSDGKTAFELAKSSSLSKVEVELHPLMSRVGLKE